MNRSLLGSIVLALALTIGPSIAPRSAEAQLPKLVLSLQGEGGGFVGDAEGAMGGLALRVGVRVRAVSIYGLSHGLVGALTAGPREGTAQGLSWNAAMVGVHVGALELAVGPSLDFAWGCGSQSGCDRGSPLFGIDGRVALHLGPLLVSLDVHPTWIDGEPLVGVVGGIGLGL